MDKKVPLTKSQIKQLNERWEDNEATTKLYEIIKMNDLDSLAIVVDQQPILVHLRSKDGRGPMWWAHEMGRKGIVSFLKTHGVSEKLRDKDGITPLDIADAADDEF